MYLSITEIKRQPYNEHVPHSCTSVYSNADRLFQQALISLLVSRVRRRKTPEIPIYTDLYRARVLAQQNMRMRNCFTSFA